MRVAVLKLSGVESAEVSLDKASAEIRFKPDNRVTLPELRELIRKNGYPTKDAQIIARTRVVDRNGQVALDLLNGSVIQAVADPRHAEAYAQLEAALKRADQTILEVEGVSRSIAKGTEQVSVSSVRPVRD